MTDLVNDENENFQEENADFDTTSFENEGNDVDANTTVTEDSAVEDPVGFLEHFKYFFGFLFPLVVQ